MIQKVNGVPMLMKVLDCADRTTVEQAIAAGRSVCLAVVTYSDCIETTGLFELVDIYNLHDIPGNAFAFNGRIVGFEVGDGSIGGSNFATYVESGTARVVVDALGAQLEFVLMLSVHFV